MIFQRYKRICNEHYARKLKLIDHHCIIHGIAHCGKQTLVKSTFKNVVVIKSCLSTARETACALSDSFMHGCVILIPRIDKETHLFCKSVCSLIDEYGSRVKFMLTSTSNSLCDELSSRCSIVHMSPLDRAGKMEVVDYIAQAENIELSQIDIDSLGTTVHDILIQIDLKLRGCHIRNDWKLYASELCTSIDSMSTLQLRTALYKLFVNTENFRDVYLYLAHTLIDLHPIEAQKTYLANKAAHYQHKMHTGNKDIYHTEAFLLFYKKSLQTI